jgi:hypothetical protein
MRITNVVHVLNERFESKQRTDYVQKRAVEKLTKTPFLGDPQFDENAARRLS